MQKLKSDFAQSSLQSVARIAIAKKTSSIIVWSGVNLVCLIIFGIFFIQSLIFFLKYPVGMTTRICNAPIEFPAVSVCNLNPYKVSSLQQNAPKIYKDIAQYSHDLIAQQEPDRQKRQIDNPKPTEIVGDFSQKSEAIEDQVLIRQRRQALPTPAGIPDNIGTTFYTTFLPNTKVAKLDIMLATTINTSFPVTITTKDNSFSKIQTIDSTNVVTVTIQTNPSVGIKLSAAYEFTAYSMNSVITGGSADGFLILPVDVLGIDYIGLGIEDPDKDCVVDIVATQDGTSVKVVFPTGSTTSYNVNEADVIELKAQPDLTGMRITSNKPVAVISGITGTSYPEGCSYTDHMVEQLTPTNKWGERFALTPFKHSCLAKPTCCDNSTYCVACYEFFKVVAYLDGTTIKRVGSKQSETFTLNALQWRMIFTGQDEFSYLTANKPLQVGQFLTGTEYQDPGTDHDLASDPSLLMVPPTDGFTNTYYIVSCNSDYTSHFLTIVIDQAKAAGLLLNGQINFLGQTIANAIPTTDLSAYLYTLSCPAKATSFRISHHDISVLFSVAAYGFGDDISYAYMAGVRLGDGSYFCTPTTDSNPPDGIDNDCDGWVDEELRNFIDDDNDGLIDEDLAAHIPMINVTSAQILTVSCDLSTIPPEADPALTNVTVDPRCFPYNLTYNDVKTVSSCSVITRRVWSLVSGCGNYADNVTQLITVTLPLDNSTAPPTAYLNSSADLSNPSATGVPSVAAACASVGPPTQSFNWTYNDVSVSTSSVNRTWIGQSSCSNVTVQLQQSIYVSMSIVFTTTAASSTASIVELSSTVTTTNNATINTTATVNIDLLTSANFTFASVSIGGNTSSSTIATNNSSSSSLNSMLPVSIESTQTPSTITAYPLVSTFSSNTSQPSLTYSSSSLFSKETSLTNSIQTLLLSSTAYTETSQKQSTSQQNSNPFSTLSNLVATNSASLAVATTSNIINETTLSQSITTPSTKISTSNALIPTLTQAVITAKTQTSDNPLISSTISNYLSATLNNFSMAVSVASTFVTALTYSTSESVQATSASNSSSALNSMLSVSIVSTPSAISAYPLASTFSSTTSQPSLTNTSTSLFSLTNSIQTITAGIQTSNTQLTSRNYLSTISNSLLKTEPATLTVITALEYTTNKSVQSTPVESASASSASQATASIASTLIPSAMTASPFAPTFRPIPQSSPSYSSLTLFSKQTSISEVVSTEVPPSTGLASAGFTAIPQTISYQTGAVANNNVTNGNVVTLAQTILPTLISRGYSIAPAVESTSAIIGNASDLTAALSSVSSEQRVNNDFSNNCFFQCSDILVHNYSEFIRQCNFFDFRKRNINNKL